LPFLSLSLSFHPLSLCILSLCLQSALD
jgi:hypothetical protein